MSKIVIGIDQSYTRTGITILKNKEIVEMDSLKRMFIAMSKDLRVILIKLADRLHNIRTVEYLSEDKRIKFCSEIVYKSFILRSQFVHNLPRVHTRPHAPARP